MCYEKILMNIVKHILRYLKDMQVFWGCVVIDGVELQVF